jgi:hypothetical protein
MVTLGFEWSCSLLFLGLRSLKAGGVGALSGLLLWFWGGYDIRRDIQQLKVLNLVEEVLDPLMAKRQLVLMALLHVVTEALLDRTAGGSLPGYFDGIIGKRPEVGASELPA